MKKIKNNIVSARFGFLLFLLIFQVSAVNFETFAQTCQPAPTGLVSWWTADGNALDSRLRNNGIMQNGAGFDVGNVGQGFLFDGIDDQIDMGNVSALEVQTGDFTIEAWVNIAQSKFNYIAAKDECGNANIYSLFIDPSNDPGFRVVNSAGGSFIVSAPAVSLNEWHHIAGVKEGSNIKIYVNGVLQNTLAISGTFGNNARNFAIGNRLNNFHPACGNTNFSGRIDEVSVYNRALSASEIAVIHAAGTAGKCKPTATVAPNDQVAWFAGDGDALDISGNSNNGTLNNNAFAVGKVGQGFDFNNETGVTVADNAVFNQQTFTIEAWITAQNFTCPMSCAQFIAAKSGTSGTSGFEFGTMKDTGFLRFTMNGAAGGADLINAVSVNDGNFHHVVASYDGATMKIFLDGVLSAQTSVSTTINYEAASPFVIGARQFLGSTFVYNGLIDEVSFYNRALTDAETQSIFNAGIAGKLKTAATPTGFADFRSENSDSGFEKNEMQIEKQTPQSPQVVNVTVGDATVSYPSVTTAGTTQQIPLDPALFPALPMGTHTGLFYDIATDAVFTGNPTVCFNLPLFNSMQFANLRVMHFEAGAWVDVTDSNSSIFPTLCTNPISSFSPFAIVSAPILSASASVGGRVFDADGRAIYRAEVVMTDSQGGTRAALTNSFGYYIIEGVPTGELYFVSVRSKEYQFQTQAVTVNDNISNLNFTALP